MDVVLQRYRPILALPGVRVLIPLMVLARIPYSGANYVLTLHVVLTLHHGYGAAGLVGAVATVGMGLGAPLMGRVIDRFGLRRMLIITILGEGTFWLTSWLMPYPVLAVAGFAGGVLTLPVMSIGRQAMAAAVPDEHRRTALAVDSMGIELSFMVGPAVGVLICTRFSTTVGLIAVGGLLVIAGIALYVVNPPMRREDSSGAARPARRTWLTAPLFAVLVTGGGAVFVLAGTEVAAVSALRGSGQLSWTGPVVILMCVASLVGGLVYGAMRRTPRPLVLMILLALLLLPAVVGGGNWWLLALLLAPSNFLCAPTLAATADAASGLLPASVRGVGMGLYSTALTFGGALGSPVIGATIDHAGPAGGFVAAAVGGLVIAAIAWPLGGRRLNSRRQPPLSPPLERPVDAVPEPESPGRQ
ncbi:MAG TPA: MFS transporter [Pseudonocardiaceae bacterium]|jgi:MFS family permease|nr:MFS transporter [Pseudonocardiaceae bacterium]